jgi:hypothetical protein
MKRGYRTPPFDDEFGYMPFSQHNIKPWQSWWDPYDDWIEVPNVQHVETSIEFQSESGMADPESAVITIDNILYEEVFGLGGLYHRMARGAMSPRRGWTNEGQRDPIPGVKRNEWFDVLNGGYRVRIWQGYGDALEPVFTGLIDDTEVGDTPDTITMTCRSFGSLLTDQRVFGDNKPKEMRSPIVFHDRLRADTTTVVGGGAAASTSDPGHPPIGVVKKGDESFWMSHAHTTEDNTEWVQVRLPQGRYTEFFVNPGYDDMEMFLSVYVRHKGLSHKATVDGDDVEDGWISRDLGEVPGINGGHPYAYHWPRVSKGGMKRELPFELVCGDDTVLRISFRRLGKHGPGDYRAKCYRLAGYKAKRKHSKSVKRHWILVDDASDCIKWALLWAGFQNLDHIEPLKVRLTNAITFDQTSFLSDIIKHFTDETDFTFHIDGFDDANEQDIGTPHFEANRAIGLPDPSMVEVRDSDLLTDIGIRYGKEPLAYIIRVRGKVPEDPGYRAAVGVPLGQDLQKRPQGEYRPPWSDAHYSFEGKRIENYPFHGRLAGLRRHVVKTDNNCTTESDCMTACLLIALRQALAAVGGSIELPGNPTLLLNRLMSVVDSASGANTRLWVTHRATTFTRGEQAEFKTTIQGALTDSPDLYYVALDYLYYTAKVQADGAL